MTTCLGTLTYTDMDRPFIYGMSVEGKNFTDRELETKRLQLNFENTFITVY